MRRQHIKPRSSNKMVRRVISVIQDNSAVSFVVGYNAFVAMLFFFGIYSLGTFGLLSLASLAALQAQKFFKFQGIITTVILTTAAVIAGYQDNLENQLEVSENISQIEYCFDQPSLDEKLRCLNGINGVRE